jgi:hypothetical protein
MQLTLRTWGRLVITAAFELSTYYDAEVKSTTPHRPCMYKQAGWA